MGYSRRIESGETAGAGLAEVRGMSDTGKLEPRVRELEQRATRLEGEVHHLGEKVEVVKEEAREGRKEQREQARDRPGLEHQGVTAPGPGEDRGRG